jgi:hypothetical protein
VLLLSRPACSELTGPCHSVYGVIPVADSLFLKWVYIADLDGTIIDSVEVYCVYR